MSKLKLSDLKYKGINSVQEQYVKVQNQILFMAYHDTLTNLPNRNYFLRELKGAIGRNEKCAVLFIDIDNFKDINDSFGHNYGDVLLKIVSELLKCCIKDKGIVARMSGDEFLILLPNISDVKSINSICQSIIDNFTNPFEIMDVQSYSSVSIGIALFDNNGEDEMQILKNSDIAMHYAKFNGKNRYAYYDDKLKDLYAKKKNIENGLQKALDNNELELYYQPQIDINNSKIRGFEALLRWKSPELGNVSPNDFIPIAEETGIMYKIGEWVLKEACTQAKKWNDKGLLFDTISINISPKQIRNNYFINLINSSLLKNGLSPESLEIEITEGTLMKFAEKSKLLAKLIEKGIKIAIDDFGKGYSSLNYLTMLPINTLKIDKSFIDRICEDNKTFLIVASIIELSKKLGYSVIAEGVENIKQAELLQNIGCDYIQGYYYSKPVPADIAEEILKNNKILNGKDTNYA